MPPILMRFGAEVSFRVRTPKHISIFSYQSLVAMETGKLILAIIVQFGHEKFTNIYWCGKKIYFIVLKK